VIAAPRSNRVIIFPFDDSQMRRPRIAAFGVPADMFADSIFNADS